MLSGTGTRSVFRIGDRVKVIDPRPILRVGYSVTVDSLVPEVEEDLSIIKFIEEQKLTGRSADRVIRAVAASRMNCQMRDGNRRQVFYGEPDDSILGEEYTVIDKRIRRTGVYYSASYSRDYFEDDYDPAGLGDITSVVCLQLLSVRFGGAIRPCFVNDEDWTGLWLISAQVEKV